MVKRYPCQIAIVFVMGIGLAKAALQKNYLLAAAIFAAWLLVSGIWMSREKVMQLKLWQTVLLVLPFLLGAVRMHVAAARLESQLDGLADGTAVVAQGRIVKKQFKDTGQKAQWVVDLADCYLKVDSNTFLENQNRDIYLADQNFVSKYKSHVKLNFADSYDASNEIHSVGKIMIYIGRNEPVIGNTVVVSGKIKLFSGARNDGNFDERAYYQNQGYTLKLYAKDGTYQVKNAEKNCFLEACYYIQQQLSSVYTTVMPEDEAGVLSAMLLGEKSMLSEETKKLYQQSGIAHILAISGLHISILGAAVYRLLRKLGVTYFISSALSMALLAAFGCMTGMGMSTMRAVMMFGIYLGAACCGRVYDSMNGLAIAAICLLMQNPSAMFLAGFQFSFAAILGVLFGKEICLIFRPKLRGVETVLISFGIQMLTLPLTAWYYFEIPVYSVLLNMIVLPFVEAALFAGLLGGSFGLLAGGIGMFFSGTGQAAGAIGLVFQIAARIMLGFCTMLLKYFSNAGSMFLNLPGALDTVGKPFVWQMTGYYAALCVCAYLIYYVKQGQEKEADKQKKKLLIRRQKHLFYIGSFFCLGLLFLRLPKQPEVNVLDVGQGDGIYIRTSDGKNVFIDGGSTDVSKVGTYRILPFLKSKGVCGVDYWFVSHLDKDHISGLEELIESGFSIEKVVFAKGVLEDDAHSKLINKLAQRKIMTVSLGKGEALQGKNSRFLCLSPEADDRTDDRNARSMVLLYEDSGFSGFFSGDISQKEEIKLAEEGNIARTIFYKAAHHGSEYSNSTELLSRLAPVVSVVSCAEKNDYGHPGKDAVGRLEKASQSVYYTMKGGRIRIGWGKGKVWVREFCCRDRLEN